MLNKSSNDITGMLGFIHHKGRIVIIMVHLPMLPVRPCVSSCFQAADAADNRRSIMAFEFSCFW